MEKETEEKNVTQSDDLNSQGKKTKKRLLMITLVITIIAVIILTSFTLIDSNSSKTVSDTVTSEGASLILMAETEENAMDNKCLLGASRYIRSYEFINVKRDQIESITILDTSVDTIPSIYVASWDVSKANDGSVTAWLVQDTTNTTMYHLYIGGKGGVIVSSGRCLFGNYGACTKISGLNKLNTSQVTDMRYMFGACYSLISLDLSSFNTSQVTDMRGMFVGCEGLTSLDVSSFNTSQVTDMRSMFDACEGLTSLDVSSFDTSQVTKMAGMFNRCKGLTILDLSSFNTSQVKDMTGMFSKCKSLTTLYLGSSFDRINGWMMFEDTFSLSSIISTATTLMKITDENGVVVEDNGLKTNNTKEGIYVPNTKAVIYVPNATVESAYEADSNYANLLDFTIGSDSPRIEVKK